MPIPRPAKGGKIAGIPIFQPIHHQQVLCTQHNLITRVCQVMVERDVNLCDVSTLAFFFKATLLNKVAVKIIELIELICYSIEQIYNHLTHPSQQK